VCHAIHSVTNAENKTVVRRTSETNQSVGIEESRSTLFDVNGGHLSLLINGRMRVYVQWEVI
jgi:hypothetical protein